MKTKAEIRLIDPKAQGCRKATIIWMRQGSKSLLEAPLEYSPADLLLWDF